MRSAARDRESELRARAEARMGRNGLVHLHVMAARKRKPLLHHVEVTRDALGVRTLARSFAPRA